MPITFHSHARTNSKRFYVFFFRLEPKSLLMKTKSEWTSQHTNFCCVYINTKKTGNIGEQTQNSYDSLLRRWIQRCRYHTHRILRTEWKTPSLCRTKERWNAISFFSRKNIKTILFLMLDCIWFLSRFFLM